MGHHDGHMEVRLCPFQISSDDEGLESCTLLERASADEVGVSCEEQDSRDICGAVNPWNKSWWHVGPEGAQGATHSMWFHIPNSVDCQNDKCTIQWTWKTANSCNPHPASYCNYFHDVPGPHVPWCTSWFCGAMCDGWSGSFHPGSTAPDNCEAVAGDRLCCSEVFTNCADVQLLDAQSTTSHLRGSSTTRPITHQVVETTSPVAETTNQVPSPSPEPEPEAEPESEPEAEPESEPEPETELLVSLIGSQIATNSQVSAALSSQNALLQSLLQQLSQ